MKGKRYDGREDKAFSDLICRPMHYNRRPRQFMLNEEQLNEFFKQLRQKHADAARERPPVKFTLINGKEIFSGADLKPELLRDFSDHFDIPIDMLRRCSSIEIELLMVEAFTNADEKAIPSLLHLPFEADETGGF